MQKSLINKLILSRIKIIEKVSKSLKTQSFSNSTLIVLHTKKTVCIWISPIFRNKLVFAERFTQIKRCQNKFSSFKFFAALESLPQAPLISPIYNAQKRRESSTSPDQTQMQYVGFSIFETPSIGNGAHHGLPNT